MLEVIDADLCESTPPLLRDWYAVVDEEAGGVVAYLNPTFAIQFHELVEAAKQVSKLEDVEVGTLQNTLVPFQD